MCWEGLDPPDPHGTGRRHRIRGPRTASPSVRETGSAYVEARLPLAQRWEGQVASRAVADDFGGSTVPFASLRWIPHETIAVRAAVSRSGSPPEPAAFRPETQRPPMCGIANALR